MADSPAPDAVGLDELEAEWRKNPRTSAFYSLASRYFEAGRTQDAYDVLRRGLEVHRTHAPAQELLAAVRAKLDKVRGSEPGQAALGRVNLKSGVRTVEERVSRKVTERHASDPPPSKVARHRPPPEDPFASHPEDEFPPPAATPFPTGRLTPQAIEAARRSGGTTTVMPRRWIAIAAILLLVVGVGVAAYFVFHPL